MKRLIKLKDKIKTIPRQLAWGIVACLLIVYVAFFDEHSLLNRFQYKRKLNRLEKELRYYQKELESDMRKLNELKSNDSNLVKFAREEYYMKRSNEDIFLIDEE